MSFAPNYECTSSYHHALNISMESPTSIWIAFVSCGIIIHRIDNTMKAFCFQIKSSIIIENVFILRLNIEIDQIDINLQTIHYHGSIFSHTF